MSDLEPYIKSGHEVVIVDDGSDDDSYQILSNFKSIRLIKLNKNYGKGVAIIAGIKNASNEKLILFDGDRELKTKQILKLMILIDKTKIKCVFACRKMNKNINNFVWVYGNSLFTAIFNYIHNSELNDALCCAKAFNKSDISIENLKSAKFDIDVEIACQLVRTHSTINNVFIEYTRRNKKQGKKLRLKDGFLILYRIIKC